MRIASVGHVAFAVMMIALGVLGPITHELVPLWQIPDDIAGHAVLVYVCALVSLATGIGLLVRRLAPISARVLLGYLVLWLLVVRGRDLAMGPGEFGPWDGIAEHAAIVAAAWILYVTLATDWDRRHVRFASGDGGLRVARIVYGVSLVPFGIAHFLYMDRTIAFVPSWIPAPAFWGYFTGIAFFAAGAAIVTGVLARLAATLSAIMIGLFTVLAWQPILTAGPDGALWNEFGMSVAITVAAYVVAESYRGMPWKR
jgi:uncharacterized membrane protein YphA (DoxX/SURF4 family)